MVDRLDRTQRPAGPANRAAAGLAASATAVAAAVAPASAGDMLDAAGPVRALPGELDGRLMVNSNHPEVLHGPGITLSTLPWQDPAHPTIHQGVPQEGSFELFTHHQNRSGAPLHQAVLLHNAGPGPVTVAVGPSAAYVTREAPYKDTPEDVVDDPDGRFVSGPGDRVATGLMRGERAIAAETITLQPGETRLVHTKEIPPGNELTSQFTFEANGPVHTAVVMDDQPPTEVSAVARLRAGVRVAPNPGDLPPTPPGHVGQKIYGRVAGVQRGVRWGGTLGDAGGAIALPAGAFTRSWVLNAKEKHTVGTDQVQTAPVISRYPDAAYAAHGNYGVEYDLVIPLRNPTGATRRVDLNFDTPPTPKPDGPKAPPVPPKPAPPAWLAWVFNLMPFLRGMADPREVSRAFRGTVAVDVATPDGRTESRFLHVSQKLGQDAGRPLQTVVLGPGESATLRVRLRYPANATAPHVLRLASPAGDA